MKYVLFGVFIAGLCEAQVTVPQGTKLRVRLEQILSSATAQEGQTVEFTVAEQVKVGDVTVIAEGARATGTITEAREKRRMGRAGKLDFSIDRVMVTDHQWVPLRYTVTKKSGESHAVRTGVITAGVAIAFWPAAPIILIMKGKDVVVSKGVAFDVYTDTNHVLGAGGPLSQAASAASQTTVPAQFSPSAASGDGSGTATVTSNIAGADIEVDGKFVGSTISLQAPLK